MKVLSNLEFKNSTYILNKFNDFPENPVEGMTIFKENGLYIYSTNISSGQLEGLNILDFTRVNSSFKFEQSSENIEWTINHNLNTQDLFVIVYDSDGNKQIESEIQFQSDNEVKLIFSEPISGKALLFGASVVSSPSNMYTKEEIDELLKNIEISGGGNSNIILPEGGSDGYLLSKNGDELGGTNPDEIGTKLPEDGLPGQVLSINNGDLTGSNPKAPVKLNVGDLVYTFNDTPPANTLFCDSSILDKNSYPELYSVIGDKFTTDEALVIKDKLMVPEWEESEQGNYVSNITSDLTLGENSYYSAIINGNIRVTTRNTSGGVEPTYTVYWYGWNVFNTSEHGASGNHANKMWHFKGNSIMEIEFLEDSFALYAYNIQQYYSKYPIVFNVYAYDEDINEYTLINTFNSSSSNNIILQNIVKINNYDNNKTYRKYKFECIPSNTYGGINILRLYGTKEGEASIYDGFALPPSSTNESGAKACIVHSSYTIQEPSVYSEDETEIGTGIDGKPIYRKIYNGLLPKATNTTTQIDISNISEVIKINSIIYDDTYILQVPNSTTSGDIYININIKENKINCYCTNSYGSGKQIKIILEYTKN